VAVPQLKLAEPQVETQTPPRQLKVDDNYILMHAKELSESLHQQRLALYPPVAQKSLRKFTSGEAAKLIGVDDGYLRQLALDGKGPEAETLPNGRRMYSLDDINALRAYLDENARGGRRYLKHRSGKEHLQIISCVNFKGGSAKTTSAAHLAQYLALTGYRVLAIDLDPQASLSALHGYQPEFDVGANETTSSQWIGRRSVKPWSRCTWAPTPPGISPSMTVSRQSRQPPTSASLEALSTRREPHVPMC
jgi:chromosome partitioning protein